LADQMRDKVRDFEMGDLFDNRVSDNWEPLLAIASRAGQDEKTNAIAAALKIQESIGESAEFNHLVLLAVGKFFAERRKKSKIEKKFFVPTREILSGVEVRVGLIPTRKQFGPMIKMG
jgi:hypothetical protein